MLVLEAFLLVWKADCLCVGLELGISGPFQVAEAGSFGGGILSWLGGLGGASVSLRISALDWDLEMLRLRVKLSLRRSDVPNDDPVASAGLGASTLETSSLLSRLAL